MQSYSKLIQFARRNNISESINPEDIGILSRKLYTAFGRCRVKVQRINLKKSRRIYVKNLSLIQVPPGHLNRQGWYLYKHSLNPSTSLVAHRWNTTVISQAGGLGLF